MKFYFFIFLILFFTTRSVAQFSDSTTKYLKLSSGGSVNKTKDGSNYLLNNNATFNVRKKRTSFNSAAAWIYGQSPEKLTNNDVTFSSNVNLYKHFPEFYYWGLMNYTSSYSLNIKAQGQAGIGIAYNFLNKENVWLNVSNGLIAETSRIIEGDTAVVAYQTIRNSLRVQFLYQIGQRFSFKTGGYYQPSLEYFSDYLFSNETELNYQLWKGLKINTRFMYNKISRTEKENMIFTYGISYDVYF